MPARQPALLYAAQGRAVEARNEFEHALADPPAMGRDQPRGRSLTAMLRLAQVLYDLGERAAAAALHRRGQGSADRVPGRRARLSGPGCTALERRLPARRGVQLVESLTEREVTVLRLLRGTAVPARDRRSELYLSPNTVKTHARAVYRKLGVSTRQDAIAGGRDIGIL